MRIEIEGVIEYLSGLGRYQCLIGKAPHVLSDRSTVFEMLFANVLERNGIQLKYEVNISPLNNSTIDFVHEERDGDRLCFELLRPEMSDELRYATTPRATNVEGISEWSVLLGSGSSNPHLRPEAQTLRMQEKLFDKVEKFPAPVNNIFSITVVDCSNFHFGHFDDEDSRMVMFGRSKNSCLQERWNGEPIMGALDGHNDRRGAKEFRERITAVIFIPEMSIDLFKKAFVVLNGHRSSRHLDVFRSKVRNNSILQKLKCIKMGSE